MKSHDISQLPVVDQEAIVGSLSESAVLNFLLENPLRNGDRPVADIMAEPLPVVDEYLPFSQLRNYISKQIPAVLARDKAGIYHIITQYDMIQTVWVGKRDAIEKYFESCWIHNDKNDLFKIMALYTVSWKLIAVNSNCGNERGEEAELRIRPVSCKKEKPKKW